MSKNLFQEFKRKLKLFKNHQNYYHYFGSLTTPPCMEGVNWNVLKTLIEVSQEQIAKFTTVYSGKARPVQPWNQKVIEVKNS